MGFVKTHRAHDTGIGKTLEDILGIKENNLRLPDVGDVELKAIGLVFIEVEKIKKNITITARLLG